MRITVGPRVSAAAISAFSVAITDGSSIRKSHGLQAERRRVELDVAAVVLDRARRARGTRRGADRAGGGRSRRRRAAACRRARSAPAAARRAGTRRGSARPARDRPRGCRRSRRRSRPRPGRATATRAPSVSSSSSHRLDVADPRDVAEDHLVVGEQARGQDRQRAVLVAGGDDRARQRHAAFDYELLHRWPERALLGCQLSVGRIRPGVDGRRIARRRAGPRGRWRCPGAAGPERSARVTAMPVSFRARRPGTSFVSGQSLTRCAATCWPSRPRCAPTRPGSTATSSSGA